MSAKINIITDLPHTATTSHPEIKTKSFLTFLKIDKLSQLMDNIYTQLGLGICLILSLYLPDLYVIFNAAESVDLVYDIILIVIFVTFVLESVTLCATSKQYFNGFFFWMDVIGTLSILIDIRMISSAVGMNSSSDASLLKAARIAKIGAKSGRLMKLTKLFKFFEIFFQMQAKKKGDGGKMPHAKEISKKLSGLLSRRVASLVMTIVLASPLLTYTPVDDSVNAHIEMFGIVSKFDSWTEAQWDESMVEFVEFYDEKDYNPIKFVVASQNISKTYILNEEEANSVRSDGVLVANFQHVSCEFSMKTQLQLESMYSLFIISLTIVLLVGFSMSFQSSVDTLVVMPLERMMNTLKTSANSILKSVQQIHQSQEADEEEENLEDTMNSDSGRISRRRKSIALTSLVNEFDDMLETEVLETIISKLAKITSLVLPGNERQYVHDQMDQSTKDWINQEYLEASAIPNQNKQKSLSALSGKSKRKTNVNIANKMKDGRLSPSRVEIRSTVVKTAHGLNGTTSPNSPKRETDVKVKPLLNPEREKMLFSEKEKKARKVRTLENSPRRATAPTISASGKRSDGVEGWGGGGGFIADKKTGTSIRRASQSPFLADDDDSDQLTIEDTSYRLDTEVDWEHLEEEISSWGFDIFAYQVQETYAALHLIFETFDIPTELNVSSHTMMRFFSAVKNRYIAANSYHNFNHAVDVTQTVYRFVIETQANSFLMPLETAALAIASLAHDIGHPGLSNQFLIKTKNEVALLYNDQSPLENMHCAALYDIVRQTKLNVFKGLDNTQWRAVRKIIIGAILGTDMVHHFSTISKLQVFIEMNGKDLQQDIIGNKCTAENMTGLTEVNNREFMIEVFLHAADISNPVKTFDVCKKWADAVMIEFFGQGDKEIAAGMPVSSMMDRNNVNKNTMQIGFIEYVVSPLYESFVRLFPTLSPLLNNMLKNHREWADRAVEGFKGKKAEGWSAEVDKLEKRYKALNEKFADIVSGGASIKEQLESSRKRMEDMDSLINQVSVDFAASGRETGSFNSNKRVVNKALSNVIEAEMRSHSSGRSGDLDGVGEEGAGDENI